MQNPRDQGHALLHRLCLLALIFVWFWISLDLWEGWELSLITLPWNYAMVAMAGLLVATFGSLQNYGAFYIKNGWQRVRESFNKANFQSSLIAFFVLMSCLVFVGIPTTTFLCVLCKIYSLSLIVIIS